MKYIPKIIKHVWTLLSFFSVVIFILKTQPYLRNFQNCVWGTKISRIEMTLNSNTYICEDKIKFRIDFYFDIVQSFESFCEKNFRHSSCRFGREVVVFSPFFKAIDIFNQLRLVDVKSSEAAGFRFLLFLKFFLTGSWCVGQSAVCESRLVKILWTELF